MNVEIKGGDKYTKFDIWDDLPAPCLIVDSNDGEIRLVSYNRTNPTTLIITPLNDADESIFSSLEVKKVNKIPECYRLLDNNVKIKLSNNE